MMTQDELTRMFTFIPIAGSAMERVGAIRAGGLEFAEEILRLAPESPARDRAVQHVLEAVMQANLAIANETGISTKDPKGA